MVGCHVTAWTQWGGGGGEEDSCQPKEVIVGMQMYCVYTEHAYHNIPFTHVEDPDKGKLYM